MSLHLVLARGPVWRRTPLMRQRAARLGHVPKTHSPYHLPERGTQMASKAPRAGVAERVAAVAVPQTREVALALITYYDQLLNDLARLILSTAQQHDAQTLYL